MKTKLCISLALLITLSVRAQTFVTGQLDNSTLSPGMYYHNQVISFTPGFTVTATTSGSYHFYISGPDCVPVAANLSDDRNYIFTTITKKPGFTDATQLLSRGTCELMQGVEYYDGLGKLAQSIVIKGSPGLND